MSKDLTERLHIRIPLIQAPMAGVSTPALAAAVSDAGALGSIGLGASSVSAAQQMIRDTKALTDKPFNVNVFCHRPAQADSAREQAWLDFLRPFFAEFAAVPPAGLSEIYTSFIADRQGLDMLLAERPAVVSFHFGVPDKHWISELSAAGVMTFASVTSVAEAQRAEQAGVDALVAQGFEAGGHRGIFDPQQADEQLDTLTLVRRLAGTTSLPLIAAGGIMNGTDIAHTLQAGASAVQMGTAFIACPESAANQAYRERLLSRPQTQMTAAISGRPARGIVNRIMTEIDVPAAPPLPDYPLTYDASKALNAAASAAGSADFAAHWAGSGVAQGVRPLPAAELVQQLAREYQAAQASV